MAAMKGKWKKVTQQQNKNKNEGNFLILRLNLW